MFQPRLEGDAYPAVIVPAPPAPVLPLVPDDELETPPLPREHPKWVKDALAISYRARQLLARIRPIAVRVATFWDHRAHGVAVRGGRLQIDFSGSYRLE